MHNRYQFFCSNQGTRNGRVHISYHNNGIRILLINYRLKSHHNFSCLYCMTPRTNTQVNIRLWNTQLFKKLSFHIIIIVLPRVK